MAANSFSFTRWQEEWMEGRRRLEVIPRDRVPPVGQWNAAQCVGHLDKTLRVYIGLWNEAITMSAASAPKVYAWWWRGFLQNIEDPTKIRSKAPSKFEPEASLNLEEQLARYIISREEMLKLARLMADKGIGGSRIASPFASWLTYPMDFSFDLAIAHERRHLRQIENL